MTRRTDRFIGLATALALQAAALFLLLQTVHVAVAPRRSAPEMTFVIPALRPAPPVQQAAPHAVRPPVVKTAPVLPYALPAPSVAAPPDSANVQGLGRMLFGCAPEAYAALPPAERARCPSPAEGMAINQPPDLMGSHTHVKNEAYWEAELARKQSNLILPCFGGLDVLCLIKSIADGTITDPKTWPIYQSKQYAKEDLYRIQQAYDAWHREHPLKKSDAKNPIADSPPPPSDGTAPPDTPPPPR